MIMRILSKNLDLCLKNYKSFCLKKKKKKEKEKKREIYSNLHQINKKKKKRIRNLFKSSSDKFLISKRKDKKSI